ncbi:MAG TPA: RidA family protein [Acidimicrobiales bacterium]|nr:RidA family protein [Acidimicrobiales bacterium]
MTNSNVELVRVPTLAQNAPYAYASVAKYGRLVFTAGACPLDKDGIVVAPGDPRAQAEQVMDNLVSALGAAGSRLEDVLKTTIYVATTDRDDLVAVWEVVRRRFGDHDAPGTLVGVSVLGWPEQVVEVEAVAAMP